MKIDSVEDYINQFKGDAKERLLQLRATVKELAPEAVESMAYGIPSYKLNGKPLIYFGGYAKHIGLYATPNGHAAFAKDFARYKGGKGSVQLPIDEPLPLELVKRVITFRIEAVK